MTSFDASDILTPANREGLIGRGSFGTVRICKIPKKERIIVAKCISTAVDTTKNSEKCANEAEVLFHVQHPNIVKVFGITEWSGAMAILTEYLSIGNLDSLLRNSKINDIPWALRLRIAYELSEALSYIHNYKQNKSFVHGDVKPDNVLLADDLTVKLADFGSVNLIRFTDASAPSIILPPNRQHTPRYTAPEFLKSPQLPRVPSMDTYSYSMVLYELITRKKVYGNVSLNPEVLLSVIMDNHQRPDEKEFKQIRRKLNKRNPEIFDTISKTMRSCWTRIPDDRLTMTEVRDILLKQLEKTSSIALKTQAANVKEMIDTPGIQYTEQNWVNLNKFSSPFEEVACQNVPVDSKPPIESDLKEEEIASLLNKENCLRIRQYGKINGHSSVVEKADSIILKHFDLFVKEGRLNRLELDDMMHMIMLKQDEVLSSEESIFYSVIAWVRFDLSSRREHFFKIFDLIDTQALSKTFLKNVVLQEDLVTNSPKCLKLMMLNILPGLSSDENPGLLMICSDRTVLRYDIVRRQFSRMPVTIASHCKGSAVSFNRQVFVIGGKSTKVVEMLDLKDIMPHWVKLAPTNEHRWYGASTTHGGYIYTSGGIGSFSSVERYNYKTNIWESFRLKDMKELRHGHALVTVKGKLYALGGGIGMSRFNSVECFGTLSDDWFFCNPMKTGRQWLAAAELDNEIYAIGGWNNGCLASVEKYNPHTDNWSEVASLNKPRFGHCACALGRRIYVVGGEDKCTVEVYDPDRNAWEIEASSPDLYDVDCVVPV